ncbi:hypothetical protein C1646_749956 [Rhizophagus diaphanus]|nr:hypothetical protein C1646_749956 [Rhizophagus diaphanus] [Rhizophagus sp. MUCL 43196]
METLLSFYILKEPQRQNQDMQYYNALQKIKFGNIFITTWTLLYKKKNNFNYYKPLNTILNIKNIVEYNQIATLFVIYMLPEMKINYKLVSCKSINILLSLNSYSPISSAIDFIDNQQYNPDDAQKLFKKKLTLLSSYLIVITDLDLQE